MELEMGLKLTRAADEFSSTEFQFAKHRAGHIFQSTETDTMFILTVHLKGYMQKNIKIDINEEGSIIAIRGEKPIQETVMVGWKLIKKDVEIRKFSKAFKIPDGVILDKIKARFDEEKSILTVKMPKKVKGILGIEFVEVKEHEDLPRRAVTFKEDMDKPTSSIDPGHDKSESSSSRNEPKNDQPSETSRKKEDDNVPKRSSKIYVPIVARSALILSLVVFVIHFIRTKNQSGKRNG